MDNQKLYNLAQLQEVAAGSEDFVNKMVDMFIDMSPALVDRIENGMLANDWEEVRSAAHKMKPSIDMMGIVSLHQTIRDIEGAAKTQTNLAQIPQLVDQLKITLVQVYEQLRDH